MIVAFGLAPPHDSQKLKGYDVYRRADVGEYRIVVSDPTPLFEKYKSLPFAVSSVINDQLPRGVSSQGVTYSNGLAHDGIEPKASFSIMSHSNNRL